MALYKDEEVIECMEARIHPTDNRVPDCICMIRITPGHIFVSEDNYDGTYVDHYVIELGQIDELKISSPYRNSLDSGNGAIGNGENFGSAKWAVSNSLVGRLFGGKNKKTEGGAEKGNPKKKYLQIIYRDENEKKDYLFFDECSKFPSVIVKAYEQFKEG